MAFTRATLVMTDRGALSPSGGAHLNRFSYATNDAAGTALAAGYFNSAAPVLKKGDIIEIVSDFGTTPQFRIAVVTARTTTSVTVALQATA